MTGVYYEDNLYTDDMFYKENESDRVWSVETPDTFGEMLFSFDKKNIFNFFQDYPQKLTKEQIEIFKKEYPELAALKTA